MAEEETALFDGQTDFSGGMRDNVSPERLMDNEYALGENIEMRDGFPTTRRGSYRLLEDSGTEDYQGAGNYRAPNSNVEYVFVVQDQTMYRIGHDWQRVTVTLPQTLSAGRVFFLQALDKFYLFHGEGNVPMSWDGNVASDWISVPVPAVGDHMPGTDRPPTYAYNRFWIITDDDTMNVSDALSEAFNFTTQNFDVEKGDGGRLLRTYPFGDGQLIAFKDKGISVIGNANAFDAIADLVLNTIDREVGAIAPESITSVGKDIFFLSRGGVYTVLQTSEQNAQMIDVPLTDPIRRLFGRIDKSRMDNAEGVSFDNYYLLAVAMDGANQNNAIFAFDLLMRKWVSFWRITDSNSDETDGYWRHNRLIQFGRRQRRLLSIGKYGGVAELLLDRHWDLVPSNDRYVLMTTGNVSRINVNGLLTSGIEAQTDGMMHFRFRPTDVSRADAGTGNQIFTVYDDSGTDYFVIDITPQVFSIGPVGYSYSVVTAKLFSGGVAQWEIHGRTKILDDIIYTLSVIHDGAEPKIYLNGLDETIQKTTTDLTQWMSALTLTDAVVGEGESATHDCLSMDLFSFSFLGVTGWDDIIARFPLGEGTGASGSTVSGYDIDGSGQSQVAFTGTFTASPSYTPWNTILARSEINSILSTRAFSFGGIDTKKRVTQGEFTFNHMQPSLTVSLINSEPFDDETLYSSLVYDRTIYEVGNKAAWVATNDNDDFDSPFREDYAPVLMVVAPSDFKIGLDGLEVDKRQEHTKLVNSMAVSEWFQLKLNNAQGMIGLKSVALRASMAGPQLTRSIR